jgi:hypothetical protein
MLTFIVPLLHPRNSPSWSQTIAYLRQTVGSIATQNTAEWRAVVVANREAELPRLPTGVEVARVDLSPNPMYTRGDGDKEAFFEAVRLDKGRRVLAGMLHFERSGHFMVVDADDLISDRLAPFVAANPDANGWYVDEGYLWEDGGSVLYRRRRFYRLCGTSHIIRADLYRLPEHADEVPDAYLTRWLGSHIHLRDDLDRAGSPLAPLPFPGAIYRIGHAGAHSQSSGLMRTVFFRKRMLLAPWRVIGDSLRIRRLDGAVRDEFFHGGHDEIGV